MIRRVDMDCVDRTLRCGSAISAATKIRERSERLEIRHACTLDQGAIVPSLFVLVILGGPKNDWGWDRALPANEGALPE